jgi:hypothetical protein
MLKLPVIPSRIRVLNSAPITPAQANELRKLLPE